MPKWVVYHGRLFDAIHNITHIEICLNQSIDLIFIIFKRLIDIPISGLMTFGYDVCHDPKNKKYSWGALVATMDLKAGNNEFFSAVNRHENGEELSDTLAINTSKAVQQFMKINGTLPARIIFYRDGVGDSQIPYVHQHEVTKVKNALKRIYESAGQGEVPFLYMIVTKRVNSRFFFDRRNPDPGTCVDDVVTHPEKYVFICALDF